MEEDLNCFANGRLPDFFGENGIFDTEDNLVFKKWKMTLIFW